MNENNAMEMILKGIISEFSDEQKLRLAEIQSKLDMIFQPICDGSEDTVLIMAAVTAQLKLAKFLN